MMMMVLINTLLFICVMLKKLTLYCCLRLVCVCNVAIRDSTDCFGLSTLMAISSLD